jgi:hypothetical protein
MFLYYTPLQAQSSVLGNDSLWVQPFLESLDVVLNNAEHIDYIVLDPPYANQVLNLPEGVSLVRDISDVAQYPSVGQRTYYVRLNSLTRGYQTVQLQWSNISIGYDEQTHQWELTTHRNYAFEYRYDGTIWKQEMSAITNINHHQHIEK